MGKRQLRLFSENLQQLSLQPYLGRHLDVVMRTGVTFSGILTDTTSDALVLTDLNAWWYNRRQHTHRIKLLEIQEVALTEQAPH